MSNTDNLIINELIKRLDNDFPDFIVRYERDYKILFPKYDHVIVFSFESIIYGTILIACKVHYYRDFESLVRDIEKAVHKEIDKRVPRMR